MENKVSNLVDIVRYRAVNQPNQVAYTFLTDIEGWEETLTYRELFRKARTIGSLIQKLGGYRERILLLYPPGLEYISAFFGCLYAGAVAVPSYPMRIKKSDPRLEAIVKDAQAKIVLTTNNSLPDKKWQQIHFPHLKWHATDQSLDCSEKDWSEQLISGDDLAFLQYTSGSTGLPKGVMVTHGNLMHNLEVICNYFQHTKESMGVIWLPPYHDMGLIGGILQPLYVGFPVVLMSPVTFIKKPIRWLQTISKYKGTTSGGPNFAYDLCVSKINHEQMEGLDLSSWDVAFNGAETIRDETMRLFAKTFHPYGFRAEAFYPCYGLAESTLIVSGGEKSALPIAQACDQDKLAQGQAIPATPKDDAQVFISCGSVPEEQQVVIVDPQSCTECTHGQLGEIWVQGPSVAKGYWNRSEESNQTFEAYIVGSGQGPYLRTGDLGFILNAELFIAGRIKDLIIIRGKNYYPQDIEQLVEKCHPALKLGCGAAFSVDQNGEERLVIVQEVERTYLKIDVEEVAKLIRQVIADQYELQVYVIVFVKPTKVPRTSSGKIQRHLCKQMFLENTLEVVGSSRLDWVEIATDKVSGVNDSFILKSLKAVSDKTTRQTLLVIYLQEQIGRILRKPSTKIQITESLSGLGLDSLMAVELVHDLEVRFGVSISMVELLEGISISQLADRIIAVFEKVDPISESGEVLISVNEQGEQLASRGQRALWYLNKFEPNNVFHNIAKAARIRNKLDIEAMKRAFQALIERHPALRTTFPAVKGEPIRRIYEHMEIAFHVEEVISWDEIQRKTYLQQEANRPFNLENGQLFRVYLLKCATDEYILLLVIHHIISDLWSMAVIMKEFGKLYKAECDGVSHQLNLIPYGYSDYVRYQEAILSGSEEERLFSYWQKQLAGELPVLNLYLDHPRPAVQTYNGGTQTMEFGQDLAKKLKEYSRANQTTLFTTLLTAYTVLLNRYTGQEDIIVGIPSAGRSKAEFANLVGYFVNMLPIRTNLAGNPSFGQMIQKVRNTVLEAFAHQEYPFSTLVEKLQPERDLSRSAIIQTVFTLQKSPVQECDGIGAFLLSEGAQKLELAGLSLETVKLDQISAEFDLSVTVIDTLGGVKVVINYNCDLFDSATIQRMLEQFQTLLEGVVNDPGQRIGQIHLMTEDERDKVLLEWNNTHRYYPKEKCVHQLFAESVQRFPDKKALVSEDGCLIFSELNQKANQLARYLLNYGVGPEVLVGICLERSAQLLIAILGVLKAGGAYVLLDSAYPQERLAYIIEDTQASVIITRESLLQQIEVFGKAVISMDGCEAEIAQQSEDEIVSEVKPDNLLYVIYTSGSTGNPKGVMIEHRAVVNFIHGIVEKIDFDVEKTILALTSVSFDILVLETLVPLIRGMTVVVAKEEQAINPELIKRLIIEYKINILQITPSRMKLLLEYGGDMSFLDNLTEILLGGEVLSEILFQKLRKINARVYNMYGPTETTVWSTIKEIDGSDRISIGKPIANTHIYILNAYNLLQPIGIGGELCIAGDGLARGYMNSPELTEQKFIPNPFQTGSVMYKTGDIARWLPNGEIDFLGRVDHQVKIRGYRIELGEIEKHLAQHEMIHESVVRAWEDRNNAKYLCAYYTGSKQLSIIELRQHLLRTLPEYMIPAHFIKLDTIPLMPNGKVDGKALPKPAGIINTGVEYKAPSTDIEMRLSQVWREVLDIEIVGVNDRFFDLGGHSLLAMRILSEVAERFGVNISLHNFLSAPSIAEMAITIEKMINQSEVNTPNNLRFNYVTHPEEAYIPFPLTEVQEAYLVGRTEGYDLGNVAAHSYTEYIVRDLEIQRLETALHKLIERHDMLRAVIDQSGLQRVLAEVPDYKVKVLDLRGIDADKVDEQIKAIRDEMSHQVLFSEQWPLFDIRATLVEDREYRLHISVDMLIGDAWSWQLLIRELEQLYQNPDLRLPELEVTFRDYVLAEKSIRKTKSFQNSLKYWQNRLKTLPPAPELPLTPETQIVTKPLFVRRSRILPPLFWEQLQKKIASSGLTPAVVLLTAFAEVVAMWSKQPRFTINLTLFNRLPLHPQLNEIIGDFTSVILLEIDITTPEDFVSRARQVQERLWESLDHRYVSGVQVMREYAQMHSSAGGAIMPVVFTSTLGQIIPQKVVSADALGLNDLENQVYSITQTPQVWLDNQIEERNGSLIYNWDAIEEIFEDGVLEEMFNAYTKLLLGLANTTTSWNQRTDEWLTIPKVQLHQRQIVNSTQASLVEKLLHELFIDRVSQQPDQVAFIASTRRMTYRELELYSRKISSWLRDKGARPNKLVAVLMRKGWEQVVAVLGVLMSGAAYLPISADLPEERIEYLLKYSEVKLILTQSYLDLNLQFLDNIQRLNVDQDEIIADLIISKPLESIQSKNDLTYVIYTSGSTGFPKGVMIDHQGAVNTILDINTRFKIESEDRVLAISSLSFDLSVYDLFGILASGGTIIIPDSSLERDPGHWLELINTEQVTVWNSVPALLEMLVEYVEVHGRKLTNHLRLVLLSGDWIPVSLPERLKALLPDVQIVSLGGATEASIWSVLYQIAQVRPDWKSIPYGKPLNNQTLHILDHNLNPRPVWVPGQIYIGGIGLARGYWRDQAKTNASFNIHPQTNERLYRTGDLGRYLPDGNIEFLGREDFQVKIRGYRIELGEIETVLQQHPGVRTGVVVVKGESQKDRRLVGYVVPNKITNSDDSPEHASQHISQQQAREVILNPIERLKFKLAHPGIRRFTQVLSRLRLIKPDLDESQHQAYLTRRTFRSFSNEQVSLENISNLLSTLSPINFAGLALSKYRYGSAGSLYPVQTYLYVKPNRVEGIEGGVYYYNPEEHSLILLSKETDIRSRIYPLGNESIFESAAFAIYLIGEMNAIQPMYGEWSRDFCLLEAGSIVQLLEMTAPEFQIGLCQIGGMDFTPLRKYFKLRETQIYLHGLLGGQITTDQTQLQALIDSTANTRSMLELIAAEGLEQNSILSSKVSVIDKNRNSVLEKNQYLIDQLNQYMKTRLPEYMIPSALVLIEELPLTPNGKIDRNRLISLQLNQNSQPEDTLPRTEAEKLIADVVKDILEVDQVNIYESFFSLGISSIQMIQVHSRLEDIFEKKIAIAEIFKHPNIRELAKYLSCMQDELSSVKEAMARSQTRKDLMRKRVLFKDRGRTEK